jgi:hypothetical protein
MDGILKWLASEPAAVWTTGGTAVIAAIQADPNISLEWKNWVTLGITLSLGLIIRGAVTPVVK